MNEQSNWTEILLNASRAENWIWFDWKLSIADYILALGFSGENVRISLHLHASVRLHLWARTGIQGINTRHRHIILFVNCQSSCASSECGNASIVVCRVVVTPENRNKDGWRRGSKGAKDVVKSTYTFYIPFIALQIFLISLLGKFLHDSNCTQ